MLLRLTAMYMTFSPYHTLPVSLSASKAVHATVLLTVEIKRRVNVIAMLFGVLRYHA
jgi:hypothetical protein